MTSIVIIIVMSMIVITIISIVGYNDYQYYYMTSIGVIITSVYKKCFTSIVVMTLTSVIIIITSIAGII